MLTRIALLFGIFTVMGFGGYMTGHLKMQHDRGASGNLPHEHPVTLALEFKNELQLSAEQIVRLEDLQAAMAKEMGPIHAKAADIHERAAKAHETGDREAMARIENDMKALEAEVKPTIERFSQEAIKILTQEQHQRLAQIVNARMADHGARDFMLMYIMHSREQLGISPQQFTKLQYLQADFIRSFAPLREKLELLHLQAKDAGKEPPRQVIEAASALEKRIKEMQAMYSQRALKEVLSPEQSQKVEQLLRDGGDQHSGSHGGQQHGGGNQHSTGGHGGGQHGTGG
jgi:hypothetical protein